MALQTNLNMRSKEQGLTVGELTIAISALIITGLIWTTISNKEEAKDSSNTINHPSFLKTNNKIIT